jgi:hypothetical protein
VAPSETGASANTPFSVMLKQATDLHREGKYQQAIAIYRLLLDSPNAPNVELRAYVFSRIKPSNEAITLFEASVQGTHRLVC